MRIIIVSILVCLLASTAGSQQKPYTEPDAPKPTTAVQAILDEGAKRAAEKNWEEAMAVANRALAAASNAKDVPGEALSHRLRARALAVLHCTKESVAAWEACAGAWERAGDGPGRVEALGKAAMLILDTDTGHADVLLAITEQACLTDAKRPQAARTVLDRIARSLNNLGLERHHRRGDLPGAARFLERAIAIWDRIAPDSIQLAYTLHYLAWVYFERGDLARAEASIRRSLTIKSRWRSPNSDDVANSLIDLGRLSILRGDLDAAETHLRRALQIAIRNGRHAQVEADALKSMGQLSHARGDMAAAEDFYRRALAIYPRAEAIDSGVGRSAITVSPLMHLDNDIIPEASILVILGDMDFDRRNLSAAERSYRKALDLYNQLIPNSVHAASIHVRLFRLANDRGDRSEAENQASRAQIILRSLAPASLDLARILNNLGALALKTGDLSQAARLEEDALAIEEFHRTALLSSEARSIFSARYSEPFQTLIPAYAALKRAADALTAVERSRGRALVEGMSERALDSSRLAPPDLLKKQDDLENRRNIAYKTLAQLPGIQDEKRRNDEMDSARKEIANVGAEQRQLIEEIRSKAPEYARLQFPKALKLPQVQAALDPGTLLLSYFVGEEESYLFAVTRTGIKTYRILMREKLLREKIASFRMAVTHSDPYAAQARDLYKLVIQPANAEIATCKRILLSPDGPLNTLPFACLLSPEGKHLAEMRPLHQTVSMTVYAEVRSHPVNQAAPILALGDPDYHQPARIAMERFPNPVRGGETLRNEELVPLPGTKQEIAALQRAYGERVVALTGRQANRSAFFSRCGEASVIHLGCHGLFRNWDPMGSCFVLTSEGKEDDGRVYAYEVMEKARLKADLVTLGACQMALGREMKGEGLIGMTRALQFAGAKSVLAPLWSVGDASSAELLSRFYQERAKGASKDVALQRAQLALLKSQKFRHPTHWAGFILAGDYR